MVVDTGDYGTILVRGANGRGLKKNIKRVW